MLVGRCVMRTAESVLLMCCPPAPDARIGVDAQVGRIDVDLDRFVHLGIDEHAREGRMPSRVRVERGLCARAGARRSPCGGTRTRIRRRP